MHRRHRPHRLRPRRTLAAGILDSMAKMPECFHQRRSGAIGTARWRSTSRSSNSRAIFEFLMGGARTSTKRRRGLALQDAVLTNLLHTSIVSGLPTAPGSWPWPMPPMIFLRTHHTEASYHFSTARWWRWVCWSRWLYNGSSQEEIQAVRA